MSAGATPTVKKTFPLDPAILGSNSCGTLELSGSTDSDVALAVASNRPFPTRPNGVLDLSHISLNASGGKPVAFKTDGVSLGFSFSAGVTAGVGIYDDPTKAIAALDLGETPGLDLSIGHPGAGSRYALFRTSYQASGSVSGSHPIGVLGSVTFGAKADASGVSAVLRRFAASAGADTVLQQTVQSWKMPRHITSANQLSPATWIVAEANGSLAVNLGAKLGYNFNFIRQAKALGLCGDIGMKIDAAATATFGLSVSGRYLVVIGRESDSDADQNLHLRLFKLKSNGMEFGLNLKVGVTGVQTVTPGTAGDFVKAVFGVHGVQIAGALGQLQKWTDPKQKVSDLVAGLAKDEAFGMLKNVTGIDPVASFDAARDKLVGALQQLQSLPDRASSELLGMLNKMDAPAQAALKKSLQLLASKDLPTQLQELTDRLNDVNFAKVPMGRLLSSLADHGLLALRDELPTLRYAANAILSILDGGVLGKLQQFIDDKLDLNKILAVTKQADFDQLDPFLLGRLSTFWDKTLSFGDIDEMRGAINLVISRQEEIYEKAQTALNSRYGLEVAATWESTSSSTAVIDAVFDLSDAKTQQLFHDVVLGTDSALDTLLTTTLPAVHLNCAVLSHELTRESTLEISLPKFNFQTQTVTKALANVHPEDDGGRLLLYDATGTNTVSVRNKFASSLTVTVAAVVAATNSAASFPELRIHSTDGNRWSYRLLYAKANMKREELEAITRPFIMQYMADKFTTGTSLSAWYNQLESTTEALLNTEPEVFGDTCASFEVTLPGSILGAWAQKLSDVPAAAKQVSVAIQQALKKDLPFFYLNNISKLGNLGSSAPLLAWASIPPAVSFNGTAFSPTAGKGVFWNHVDAGLRKAAATHADTVANLRVMLPELCKRLEEAGLNDTAQFYQDNQANQILAAATNSTGDILLESLLLFESNVVFKANDAINDMQKFLAVASSAPSQAVDRLAQFAADIVTAFNQLVGNSVFADLSSFRAVAQVVFAEASRALGVGMATQPAAMLTLDILNPMPPRTFQLSAFLKGTLPTDKDIAVEQRLVTI
jgi:hypothetical protein